ncbi:FG-GAP repeat protein [Catellatospora coxensis]
MRALRAAAVALVLAGAVLGAPGAATATGIAGPACDFNGDGRSDLAVGVPGRASARWTAPVRSTSCTARPGA